MKTVVVISEYNPFHNGHSLHISLARARTNCDFAVALMSGNFVQRGEPAIVDKYHRTRMALADGFDMVLELPVYFATASAEHFAYGAVRILNVCGIFSSLAFGSESGDISELEQTARALADETENYRGALKSALDNGISFPRARERAMRNSLPVPNLPNDILGVEYLKALYKTGSNIEPIAIPRVGAGYHKQEIDGDIASATAIRRAVLECRGEKTYLKSSLNRFCSSAYEKAAQAMPAAAWDILNAAIKSGNYVRGLDSYAAAFRYALLAHPELGAIMDIAEGLENRFLEMSGKLSFPSDIIDAVKTKRYTHTRLNRAALHVLLDLRRADFERYSIGDIPYIRVLGMKKTAGTLMNALTAAATCPIVTTLAPAKKTLSGEAWKMLKKEIATTDIYYLGLENREPAAPYAEWREGFVVV